MAFSENRCTEIWKLFGYGAGDQLDLKQLLNCLHCVGLNPSNFTLQQIRQDCRAGLFTFADLVRIASSLPLVPIAQLEASFKLMDEDGDGWLSYDELRTMLMEFGERMSEREVQDAMRVLDANADGRVSFSEFAVTLTHQLDALLTLDATRHPTAPIPHHPTRTLPLAPRPPPASDSPKNRRRTTAGPSGSLAAAAVEVVEAGAEEEDEWGLVTPREPERGAHSEPLDLQTWASERLHGTFQAHADGYVTHPLYSFAIATTTDVFLTLRVHRRAISVDTALFVARVAPNKKLQLIAVAPTHLLTDPSLRLTLDPGKYYVIPFSTGCNLHTRTAQPVPPAALSVVNDDGELVLSEQARVALKEVFQRLDLDGQGRIGRQEYNMLMVFTDGEACDDDTWEYITTTFQTRNGELTLEGFFEMYTAMLAAQGNDDEFYANFAQLGYNRRLELDEAATFVLFVFSKEPQSLLDYSAVPFDKSTLDALVADSVTLSPSRSKISPDVTLTTLRGDLRVSLLLENKSAYPRTVIVDASKCVNVKTNACDGAKKTVAVLAPNGRAVVLHLMPSRADAGWHCEWRAALDATNQLAPGHHRQI